MRMREALMRGVLMSGAVIGGAVAAALLAATAGAGVRATTGDTCSASGNSATGTTTYTLSISLAPNAPPQGGFAIGAPGVTVKSLSVSGTQGTFSTSNLPASTTGELILATPTTPAASIVAVVRTSGPVTGSFTVVPTSSPASTFFAPFPCAVEAATSTTTTTATLTTAAQASYDSATGAWRELVSVSAPGTVRSTQELPTAGGVASKPLIQAGEVGAKSAGKVALMLRPTGDGKAALIAHGSIRVKLSITFKPTNGKPANVVVGLTLKQ
jgi:hypothetical protein